MMRHANFACFATGAGRATPSHYYNIRRTPLLKRRRVMILILPFIDAIDNADCYYLILLIRHAMNTTALIRNI